MQKAVNLALLAAIAVLGAVLLLRPAGPDAATLRAMVDEAVAARLADDAAGSLEARIESFLLDDPRILERLSLALERELRREERENARIALAFLADEIYDDPANIVLGNPEGDVTLVEMFDYNCSFCRQVVPDVMALVAEDPGLRVILMEYPILSKGSVDAARIGVLVNREAADRYADYHTALFSARGTVDGEAALAAARALGLNPIALELDMNTDSVTGVLQRSHDIARELGISGTPAFIIGDEVIHGAVAKEELERRIANMRACGETVCADASEAAPR